MRPRSLLVLTALVLGLGAFIWFYERELPGTEKRKEQEKKVFGALAADEVREVAIRRDGTTVRLVRETPAAKPEGEGGDDGEEEDDDMGLGTQPAAEWRLAAPLTARADRFAVDGLVSTLLAIEKGRALQAIDRKTYGLAPPAATVTLTADGETHTLEVGREIPGTDQRVVALAGGADGWAVSSAFWSELTKAPADWRSRELFPGQRDEVERIAMRQGGGAVVLARRGSDFWVEAPLADLADRERVDELLGALTALQAEEFLDQAPPAAGLEPAQSVIEVMRKGRQEPFRVVLGAERAADGAGATDPADAHGEPNGLEGTGLDGEDGLAGGSAAAGEGVRYARAGGQLVTVKAPALAEALGRPAEQWRSRAVSSLAVWEIDRIEVGDGQGKMTLVRDEGDWQRTIAGQPGAVKIFYGPVSDLLAAVADARADRVLAVEAAQAQGYVAAQAQPAVTFDLVAGEGEGESKKAQRLSLFAPAAAGRPTARAADRQAVLVLPAGMLAEVRGKLEAVREAEALKPEPTPTPPQGR